MASSPAGPYEDDFDVPVGNTTWHHVPEGSAVFPTLPARLSRFVLYETTQRYYLIGSDERQTRFKLLKIDRTSPTELNIAEDPHDYSKAEAQELLHMLSHQELTRTCAGFGILGFVRFLQGWTLLLVTKRKQVGTIRNHKVYAIEDTAAVYIPHPQYKTEAHRTDETRYKRLFFGMDLRKFYFSYTYDITRTLQCNLTSVHQEKRDELPLFDEKFTWNLFLMQPLLRDCSQEWVLPMIHGVYIMSTFAAAYHRPIGVTLISRRSRHFAGTRYLKRGCNECGHVANDVETEQIVEELSGCVGRPHLSSFVQCRGSIPLFWMQDNKVTVPKPPITVYKTDPFHNSAIRHFMDVFQRYGTPCIVLNLVKHKEKNRREMILGEAFTHAVKYVNMSLPKRYHLDYIAWDFHRAAKSKSEDVIASMISIARETIVKTGFFHTGKCPNAQLRQHVRQQRHIMLREWARWRAAQLAEVPEVEAKVATFLVQQHVLRDGSGSAARAQAMGAPPSAARLAREASVVAPSARPTANASKASTASSPSSHTPSPSSPWYGPSAELRQQRGVLRSNCIDSLDRTNATQFCIGTAVLGKQLHAMGIASTPVLEFRSDVVTLLLQMYEEMGDCIALQYAGSQLAHRMDTYSRSSWSAFGKDLLTSLKRYYTSTFTDTEKQSSINLFLGRFVPWKEKTTLWVLPSDYDLHMRQPPFGRPLTSTTWWVEPLTRFEATLLPSTRRRIIDRHPYSDTRALTLSRNVAYNDAGEEVPMGEPPQPYREQGDVDWPVNTTGVSHRNTYIGLPPPLSHSTVEEDESVCDSVACAAVHSDPKRSAMDPYGDQSHALLTMDAILEPLHEHSIDDVTAALTETPPSLVQQAYAAWQLTSYDALLALPFNKRIEPTPRHQKGKGSSSGSDGATDDLAKKAKPYARYLKSMKVWVQGRKVPALNASGSVSDGLLLPPGARKDLDGIRSFSDLPRGFVLPFSLQLTHRDVVRFRKYVKLVNVLRHFAYHERPSTLRRNISLMTGSTIQLMKGNSGTRKVSKLRRGKSETRVDGDADVSSSSLDRRSRKKLLSRLHKGNKSVDASPSATKDEDDGSDGGSVDDVQSTADGPSTVSQTKTVANRSIRRVFYEKVLEDAHDTRIIEHQESSDAIRQYYSSYLSHFSSDNTLSCSRSATQLYDRAVQTCTSLPPYLAHEALPEAERVLFFFDDHIVKPEDPDSPTKRLNIPPL